MSENGPETLAPRCCRARDLAGLIGLLALLEGELMAEGVPERLAHRIAERLNRAGLLDATASDRELRQAISDLNHRLRYALGEYEEPPQPFAVPE